MNILIFETDLFIRRALAEHLLSMAHEVIEAESEQACLELITEKSPDLLLLELKLPTQNGQGILAQIKAASPALPIVILSGFDKQSLADNAKYSDLESYPVISKPYRLSEVSSLIRSGFKQPGHRKP